MAVRTQIEYSISHSNRDFADILIHRLPAEPCAILTYELEGTKRGM
jgi:hypothetical protein